MTRRRLTTAATATLVSICGAFAPPADTGGVDPPTRLEASEKDRCPVCGMLVGRHPEWLAGIVYADGSEVFFDGPKDLFRYLLAPERHDGARRDVPMASVLVTSYYEGAATPAQEAFYVVGSDVTGPMGAELVPHRTSEDAETFARDHHGERVLRFADVTRELLEELS